MNISTSYVLRPDIGQMLNPKIKKNALKLTNLLEMRNPFERLRVYSNDLGYELLARDYLHTLPDAPSIAEMKRYMMEAMQCSCLPCKIDRLIAEHEIELFDKRTVWEQ
ncbi:hypothetical protein AH88_07285 [Salmonella enterica subsp. enterica serovar Tennessee]|nr:hypothetical protein SEET0821_24425 [Salmonella enterica subsp. enterica serovar Tennessee str. TXSC_TXSC08-21]KWQ15188.1 hypothetical protein Y596_08975 [Salmonella enterica subsp. enterica serovar Tennessee]KWQ31835.1 hypothetical protein AH92_04500 [Salmonella enterica subsp. enterica serovar Tennessee]KZG44477.1 hypothetical protein AH88_07285 [Salmonella enterica subsp. enterica serovar Tennessee]